MVFRRKNNVPDLVTSGMDTVAVRIPEHPMTRKLLQNLPFPLAAPSANPFGYVSPTTAQHVADQLGNTIDYILDGGPCSIGIESTIIAFTDDAVEVLRKGGLAISALEAVSPLPVIVKSISTSKPAAPGQLHSHYAPHTSIYAGSGKELIMNAEGLEKSTLAWVCYDASKSPFAGLEGHHYALSSEGDDKEAAQHLFSLLRELDQNPKIHKILIEWAPEQALGVAINDRLRRAAYQSH
jgi:L-threonylcarbamoyladenylate synthase